jgi:hypothetical protein
MSPVISPAWSDAGATLEFPTGERLTYRCEPDLHRIAVRDSRGQLRFAFGGRGSGPGQFDTPLAVVLVAPEFTGEPLSLDAPDAAWLAVADYGNRRVQILDLDGCFVGTVADRDGHGPPCQLAWRAPTLIVDGVEGARTVIHLTAALLYASTRFQGMPARSPGAPLAGFRCLAAFGETN